MAEKLRHAGREGEIAALAQRRHGVVSRKQLIGIGVGERTIDRWLSIGRLRAVHRDVFVVGYAPLDQRGRWWAGLLAYGDGALLSHRSAAKLWGLARERRSVVEVTAPAGRQGIERRRGLWIHRCRLTPADRTTHGGISVTTVARTLFDFAEAAELHQLERAWEEADRLKLLRLEAVAQVCERGHGRRALRPIRRLLAEARTPGEGRSPLEERFQRFCGFYDLPPYSANVDVLGNEVDALWPAAKLVVELDSWEYHGHRDAFERDRARDPAFLLAGYRTIRVTHRRLDKEADKLAAEIRQLLARRPA